MSDIQPVMEGLYPPPGTQEFRDFIDNSYPRKKNEKKAAHHRRIAKELGFNRLSRMAELYGDPRSRIHQREIELIFHSAYPPRKDQVSSLTLQNNQDLQELKALKKELINDLAGLFDEAFQSFIHTLEAGAR